MEQQIVKRKQKSYYKKIRPTQPEINWNFRFMQLKDYKKRFGNCEVPQNWPENKQLGRWVIRQRTYKWRLIPERVDALNSIGFSWNTLDKNWEANFKELVAFKEKFGHCDV